MAAEIFLIDLRKKRKTLVRDVPELRGLNAALRDGHHGAQRNSALAATIRHGERQQLRPSARQVPGPGFDGEGGRRDHGGRDARSCLRDVLHVRGDLEVLYRVHRGTINTFTRR